MRADSSATTMSVALLGCFLCGFTTKFASALTQQQPPVQSDFTGRRGFLAGMAGIASLALLPHNADAVISSKYCAYGEGNDCEDLAEGNPYILELQRKSAANKEANIVSAKNAYYAKNYPDWFAAVGKTMVQKESDGSFIVVDNMELSKLWDEGKLQMSTPMAMGGKVKDVTQKPMLMLKE